MKIYHTLISLLVLSMLFTSCKKDKDLDTSPTPTVTLPVVFTANVNFVDEGVSVAMNGVPNYSSNTEYTPTTAGLITDDSLLYLFFVDEATHIDFSLTVIEKGGDLIQPGTYSFTESVNNYDFLLTMENKQSNFTYSYTNGFNNQGFQYQGQTIVSNGTLTITSVSQTSISGTLSAELYYSTTSDVTNQTHKVLIDNGSFSCDIIRF